jgi:hypothetical protein
MRNRGVLLKDFGHKVVSRFLFNFSEIDFTPDFIFFILNDKALELLNPGGTKKCSTELIDSISGFNTRAILEFEFSFALVPDGKRVHAWTDFDIIVATEPVTVFGSIDEEVANRRVVRDLFSVDSGAIGQRGLKRFA